MLEGLRVVRGMIRELHVVRRMIRLEEGFRFVRVYRERFEESVFLLLFAIFFCRGRFE